MEHDTANTQTDSRPFTTVKIKRHTPIGFLALSFGLFFLSGIIMLLLIATIDTLFGTCPPIATIGAIAIVVFGCTTTTQMLWRRTCRKYWLWMDTTIKNNDPEAEKQSILDQIQELSKSRGIPSFVQHPTELITAHHGIGQLAVWLSKHGLKGETLQVVDSQYEAIPTPIPFETPFPALQLSRATLPRHPIFNAIFSPPNTYPATPESVPKNLDHLVTIATLGAPFALMAQFFLASNSFSFSTFGVAAIGIFFAIAITLALRWFFWRTEWHIVPGGVVIRKTSPFIKGWDVHSINPSESVLTCFPAKQFLSIATADGQYWARPVSSHQAGYLLRAWQMDVEPPSEGELADFG